VNNILKVQKKDKKIKRGRSVKSPNKEVKEEK
jgi:hypothetical protein